MSSVIRLDKVIHVEGNFYLLQTEETMKINKLVIKLKMIITILENLFRNIINEVVDNIYRN